MPPPTTTSTTADDDLLTPEEVADFYKVTTRTVNRWDREGILIAIKITRSTVRYRRGDLPSAAKVQPK